MRKQSGDMGRSGMKDLRYLQLFDIYGGLLTGHRREVCELYYGLDLSLAEIAEQKGVSRQSVSDTLAKCRALLDGYEEKLHIYEINQKNSEGISGAAEKAMSALRKFLAAHPEYGQELQEVFDALYEAGADRGNLAR